MVEALLTVTPPADLEAEAPGGSPAGGPPEDVFVFPVSHAQERLWFVNQLEPGSPAYNLPIVLRAEGQLDLGVLESSLNEIIRRHEALRTTFAVIGGQPMQLVGPELKLALRPEPASGPAEAERLVTEAIREPFDLARGPLFKARLWRLGEAEHVLLLNLHHTVADGWSFEVLLQELGALYTSLSEGAAGAEPSLPGLPIQYADYAVWQREWLQGEALEAQLDYWKKQLAVPPPDLGLPADRPRGAVRSSRGALLSIPLDDALAEALKGLSRRESATLFMTLLAAFKTLLHRLSGQADIAVGSPVANRNQAEVEGLIGVFINTLVFRADLSGDPTFRELLGRVREAALGAYAHQEVPFERLVEELRPDRDRGRNPLFQAMFMCQRAFIQPLELPGLTLVPERMDRGGAVEDLTLFVLERAGRWTVSVEYNTDLFDARTMRRWLGHYQTLLEAVAADPDRHISELPLLTAAERDQLILGWNETQAEYPREACLHQLFEAQAARTPEAVALVAGGRRVTYGELNRGANQLARHLRRLGVGPGALVGLFAERSVEMVVGLLAVLKAGGAYVPLDTAYPAERLAFMVADARLQVLLSQHHLLGRLPGHEARVVCLDRDAGLYSREPADDLPSEATADNLAYVIYTSGSTGRPKGAMIHHRGLVNYLCWCAKEYGIEGGGGAPVHSPVGFDLTVTSLLAPLVVGQQVILLPEGEGIETLEQLRGGTGYGVVKLTPAHLEFLSRELRPDEAATWARALVIGGEALRWEELRFWARHAPATRLINEYGPTETVVGCCVYEARAGEAGAGGVPIGRPIANTRLYVLDARLGPVPIGVTGELYVGGDGVARGYLNRPELTAERFVADPFAADPGARLYRTGDLARYREDGVLEFLGRADEQVKVRGYRVEPGEIEAVLREGGSVREAVVVAREDGTGGKRLVAYVVPAAGAEATGDELRRLLSEKLPAYMVPSAFVTLDALPLTPNGKIDRRALPAPEARPAEDADEVIRPRDELERRLTGIWEATFGLDGIGVRDDFFALGGHSLLAVRLFARIETEFQKTIPLAMLFEAPTVEKLAALLRREGWKPPSSSLVALQPRGSKRPFFCIHAAGGNVLFYRDLAKRLGPARPFYGLQAQGLDGTRPHHETVEEMARHYVTEIREAQPEGPYYLGGSSFGGLVAFEMACLLREWGEEVGLLALFDTWGPGYPRLLPGMTKWRYRLSRVADRVEHHIGSIRMLESEERWGYIKSKAIKSNRQFWLGWRRLGSQLMSLPQRALEQHLPRELRQAQGAILQANEVFTPRVYPGVLTLFRANKQPSGIHPDPTLGWGSWAAGEVEIHEVPGSHGTIVVEPRVRFLVEKLEPCLERHHARG